MNTRKTILLVEDDKDDQCFFMDAINKIENAVLYAIAENGIDALEKLTHSVTLPDLIFMDINMPMMNGIECLEAIQRNPVLKDIPVIMLSTSNEQLEKVCTSGARAFLKKPADERTLCTKLQEMINLDFLNSYYGGGQFTTRVYSSS